MKTDTMPDVRIISLFLQAGDIVEVNGMIAGSRLEWRAVGLEFWVRTGEYERYPIGFYSVVVEITMREGVPRSSLRRAI